MTQIPEGMTCVIEGFKQEGPARRGRIMGRWVDVGFFKEDSSGKGRHMIVLDSVPVSGLRHALFTRPIGAPNEPPPEEPSDDLDLF